LCYAEPPVADRAESGIPCTFPVFNSWRLPSADTESPVSIQTESLNIVHHRGIVVL